MRKKTGNEWPHQVTKKDLKISFFRGSGPGGQKRNKTDSACRIVHIPTGLSSESQEHKSQKQNIKAAFGRLCEKLIPIMKKEVQQNTNTEINNERIRTYKESKDVVKDHRTNIEYSYNRVLDGKDLDSIIKDLKNQT